MGKKGSLSNTIIRQKTWSYIHRQQIFKKQKCEICLPWRACKEHDRKAIKHTHTDTSTHASERRDQDDTCRHGREEDRDGDGMSWRLTNNHRNLWERVRKRPYRDSNIHRRPATEIDRRDEANITKINRHRRRRHSRNRPEIQTPQKS